MSRRTEAQFPQPLQRLRSGKPQNRVGRHDRRDLAQRCASKMLSSHRETTPVIIRESQKSAAQLGPQDAILLHRIPDHILLTSTEPAGEGRKEYLKRRGDIHRSSTLLSGPPAAATIHRLVGPAPEAETMSPASAAVLHRRDWQHPASRRPVAGFSLPSSGHKKRNQQDGDQNDYGDPRQVGNLVHSSTSRTLRSRYKSISCANDASYTTSRAFVALVDRPATMVSNQFR
jgi:hypothetical protein